MKYEYTIISIHKLFNDMNNKTATFNNLIHDRSILIWPETAADFLNNLYKGIIPFGMITLEIEYGDHTCTGMLIDGRKRLLILSQLRDPKPFNVVYDSINDKFIPIIHDETDKIINDISSGLYFLYNINNTFIAYDYIKDIEVSELEDSDKQIRIYNIRKANAFFQNLIIPVCYVDFEDDRDKLFQRDNMRKILTQPIKTI